MNINEFSIACKLINLKLRGFEVPPSLPPSLVRSLQSLAGILSFFLKRLKNCIKIYRFFRYYFVRGTNETFAVSLHRNSNDFILLICNTNNLIECIKNLINL